VVGKTIGHYQIATLLGRGGMGEVYRAEDTRLSRPVAIKILPDEFVGDDKKLSRFEREAQLLAAINHPNIAAIYGLEKDHGRTFLVLELVEGSSLAARLKHERLPMPEALNICRQIAEGLEAAHDRGIVHRDLKPGNVMLTPEGQVKILDFGLARSLEDRPAPQQQSDPSGITEDTTRPGAIMGTAAYMSPEQARGKSIDKRTDIWAFGCILFECISGQRAFDGDTFTETLAAIIRDEPAWKALPAATPWRLKDLLHHCLQKDPHERLRDIGDARIELCEALPAATSTTSAGPGSAPPGIRLPWLLTIILMMALAAILLKPYSFSTTPAPSVMRFSVDLPTPLVPSEFPDLAISPDGRQVVYVGDYPVNRLYYRNLQNLEFRPIQNLTEVANPFFSPDGQWIGFFTDGSMKAVPVAGGPPVLLAPDVGGDPGGGYWGAGGRILFQGGWHRGIFNVTSGGGTPSRLVTTDAIVDRSIVTWPQELGARGSILFTAGSSTITSMNDARIAVQSGESNPQIKILTGGTYGRYLATGHLVYLYDGKLMAVPFDSSKLQIYGTAVPVVEGIVMSSGTGSAELSISETGHLLYAPGPTVHHQDHPLLIDIGGKEVPISLPAGGGAGLALDSPAVSADGAKLAVRLLRANDDIYLFDFAAQELTRVTFEEGDEVAPTWDPTRRRLAYTSEIGLRFQMYIKDVGAGGASEAVFPSPNPRYPASFSYDGRTLAFVEYNPESGWDILTSPSDGRTPPTPFIRTEHQDAFPSFSPDGHWMTYQSNRSGQSEVYLVRYPEGTGEKQISTSGGREPRWSPIGNRVFFRANDGLYGVDIESNPDVRVGRPNLLFSTDKRLRTSSSPQFGSYTIMPDGRHFIFVRQSIGTSVERLSLVLNWFEELKRRCPARPR